MGDDLHKPGLYRWKRQSDSRIYSRSQKITSNGEIQNWIKKVEQAADRAAEVAFEMSPTVNRHHGKTTALTTVQQLREHDQAMSEAQELLKQWTEDKVRLDNSADVDDALRQQSVEADVKREWDHLLEDNCEEYGVDFMYGRNNSINRDDVYVDLFEEDEGQAVSNILRHMNEKEFVHKDVLEDLGLEKWSSQKDPKMKMELRHQQVKQRREKREADLEKKRQTLIAKKDAHSKAKQMIMKEEQEKQAQAKQEDILLKKEMAKIRKTMQEERRRVEEIKLGEALEKEVQTAQSQLENKQRGDGDHRRIEEQHFWGKQQHLLHRKEQLDIRLAAQKLRILQRHFSAWYGIVLEQRLAMGKARAMSDWKLMLQCWNAWRSYVRSKRLNNEAREHEFNIIDMQRKGKMAADHYQHSMVHRCFQSWRLFVQQEQERRALEHAQKQTHGKMVAFLEAAAAGKLGKPQHKSEKSSGKSTASKIDDMFYQSPRRPESAISTTTVESIDIDIKTPDSHKTDQNHNSHLPREAWQVTKKHLNLKPEEIAQLGGEQTDVSDLQVRRRFGTQPWMNRHYEVNSYENRHKSQQKILHDQQKQIKEQKRLIEELQFTQNQQMLQQQLAHQHLILQQLQTQQLTGQPVLSERSQESSGQTTVKEQPEGEQHLNNLLTVQKSPRNLEKLQRNKVIKEKDTNVTQNSTQIGISSNLNSRSSAHLDSARTNSAKSTTCSTDRSKASSNSKYLTVLQKMEQRATERAKVKAERDNKKRIAEEERLRQLQLEEEELKRREEEEKKSRIQAHREKKRQEKLKEVEKRQFEEKMRQLCVVADEHFLKSLMKYRGLVPMKKLVIMSEENKHRAQSHYKSSLLRKVMKSWHNYTEEVVTDKEKMADEMYNYLIAKRCFHCWRLYKYHQVIMEEKARRFHEQRLKSKVISVWADYAIEEKFLSWENEKQAEQHYIWLLKKRSLNIWKALPEEIKKEQEREKRRADMRRKVASLLPDFSASLSGSSDQL